MIFSVVILCVIYVVSCTPGNFSKPAMCEFNDRSMESHDCSFQISHAKVNSCLIYNTSGSKKFVLEEWTRVPVTHPVDELSAKFSVSAWPYAGMYILQQILPVSAVNITLTSASEDINGFLLHLYDMGHHRNIRRIFDFRVASRVERRNISLFYDCIHSMCEHGVNNYILVVKSLPLNEVMEYRIFFPDAEAIEATALCFWRPLIMVFVQNFKNNIVDVKFSQAPSIFDTRGYDVSLVNFPPDGEATVVEVKSVESTTKEEMLMVRFRRVNIGYYYVHVKPFSWKDSCDGAATEIFFIPTEIFDGTVPYIVGFAVLCVILVVAVLVFIRWLYTPRISSPPKVVLVYSYDIKEDNEVAMSFQAFLEHFYCEVFRIYGDEGDPVEWMTSKFQEATAVVTIISYGLFHIVEKGNLPAFTEEHTWLDIFSRTYSFLRSEIHSSRPLCNRKKLAKVFFDYSGIHEIPKCMQLESWGETFALPKDMNRFLCYLFDQEPKVPWCCGAYPLFIGSDISSLSEGEELKCSIAKAEDAVKKGKYKRKLEQIDLSSCKDSRRKMKDLHNPKEWSCRPSYECNVAKEATAYEDESLLYSKNR